MRVLVLLALAALLAPAASGSSHVAYVNVVTAANHGCSPDSWTSPDLRVTVYADGDKVLETVKAQDDAEPLYAAVATFPDRGAPVRVTVEIHEAEPGGFLGLGTSWVLCDASPGEGFQHNFTWSGETTRVVAKGDTARAAEAVVVVGTDAPPAPTATATATETAATIAWDADPTGQATAHVVTRAPLGEELGRGGAGAGSVTVRELCDNTEHRVRVVREASPWHVGSAEIFFYTKNAAPPAPLVEAAERDGANVTVRVGRIAHDAADLEIHAGASSGFDLGSSTLRARVSGNEATFVPKAGDLYVRARVVDSGGLKADSEAFEIGAESRFAGSAPCTTSSFGAPGVQEPGAVPTDPAVREGSVATSQPPPFPAPRDGPRDGPGVVAIGGWVVAAAAVAALAFVLGKRK